MSVDRFSYFPCDCHDPVHFIKIDASFPHEIYIALVSSTDGSLWAKLKNIFAYLFKREEIVVGEVVLNKEEAIRLSDELDKFIDYMEHFN